MEPNEAEHKDAAKDCKSHITLQCLLEDNVREEAAVDARQHSFVTLIITLANLSESLLEACCHFILISSMILDVIVTCITFHDWSSTSDEAPHVANLQIGSRDFGIKEHKLIFPYSSRSDSLLKRLIQFLLANRFKTFNLLICQQS